MVAHGYGHEGGRAARQTRSSVDDHPPMESMVRFEKASVKVCGRQAAARSQRLAAAAARLVGDQALESEILPEMGTWKKTF